MDEQIASNWINELTLLMNNNQDHKAYERFREMYFNSRLVTKDGDDTWLGRICNPIGLDLLHLTQQWDRERDWWQNVINVMEEYDKENNTNLHKGLAYHNMTLPLLELNLPETAKDFLLQAIHEDDRKAGNTEAKRTPAYNMACFLIPIVETHQWRNGDNRLSTEERNLLIASFNQLFIAFDGDMSFAAQHDAFNEIRNEELRRVLVRRYNIIHTDSQRETVEDPPRVAIYSGSIIEGFLTFLLQENFVNAINEFRRLATNNAAFVNYLFNRPNVDEQFIASLIDEKSPLQGTEEERKRVIDTWDFNQKIKVARGINVFSESQYPALGILCQLLREYRNIVHPTNNEVIGTGRNWDITFEINSRIAKMLKTALDIVLYEFHEHPTTFARLKGLNFPRVGYTSLASASIPITFDENGREIPSTTTVINQKLAIPTASGIRTPSNMGSTTTTTD